MNVLRPDPFLHAETLSRLAELALLISLFSVGLQLGVPLRDRRWLLPLRLAFLSMALMVSMITAIGIWLLHLPLGAAVLLGAMLAPTDPVLASGVQSDVGIKPDRLGFSLAGEGGLNDGAAYPFVMLGLGILGLHGVGPGFLRWWSMDLIWSSVGGALIGGLLGAAIGRLVIFLRSRRGEAVGFDVFLGLGLVAVVFGLAQISLTSGFLAVFAAGLALQRVQEAPHLNAAPAVRGLSAISVTDNTGIVADIPLWRMRVRHSVQSFNEQLEKLAELGMVLMVGAMLAYAPPLPAAWWFVPVLLLLLRPISVLAATIGERLSQPQRALMSWFGIRGIGSVFYLLLALHLGVNGPVADTLVSLTLWTVASSIVAHGLTAQPLMQRYLIWRGAKRQRRGAKRDFS